jgi:hypothetical protein
MSSHKSIKCPEGEILNTRKNKCVKDGHVIKEILRIEAIMQKQDTNKLKKKKVTTPSSKNKHNKDVSSTRSSVYYSAKSSPESTFHTAKSSISVRKSK